MKLAILPLVLLLAGCSPARAPGGGGGIASQKIVSTNPCADAILIDLVPANRIAAISHYSQDPGATSIPLDVANRFASTTGTAEEVIALNPALVLTSSFTPASTRSAYERAGLKTLLLDSPVTIAASKAQVLQIAEAVGAAERGRALNARIDRAVVSAQPEPGTDNPSALLFIAGDLVNGSGTLLDELLATAGFRDAAIDYGLAFTGTLPIETIAAKPPRVILTPRPVAHRDAARPRACPHRREHGRGGLPAHPRQLRRPDHHPRHHPPRGDPPAVRFMNRKLALLAALVILAFGLSLIAGKTWIPPQIWFSGDPRVAIIVELRLPRAILGLALGAVLGLSGAVLQGYLRNPLADPAVVGVSSSAALGAVAAIVLGIAGNPLVLFACAMLSAGGSMALLAALTWRSPSPVQFILAGTVLASLAGALTAFLISIAPNPYAVAEVIDWLMGALTDRSIEDVRTALPFMAVGAALLFLAAPSLDALTLGEAAARSLGVRLGRLQVLVVLGTGLTIGASVAVTGVVGFVGLVVPHLLRPIFGHRPAALLLPSALGGAALVLVADSLCRLAPGAGEVRLGVAMALLGAPFFLMLLLRGRASWN